MKTKKTTSYSSIRQARLANPAIAAEYLNEARAESHETFMQALFTVAQARQMSKVAKDAGVQRETLYRSLSDQGNPTLDTFRSVLDALGLDYTFVAKNLPIDTEEGPREGTGYGSDVHNAGDSIMQGTLVDIGAFRALAVLKHVKREFGNEVEEASPNLISSSSALDQQEENCVGAMYGR